MHTTATNPVEVQRRCGEIAQRLHRVVALGPEVVEPLLVAVLAHGHVLIEGVPGIGKTLLARTLARCLHADFRRIQFTNDLMPADIVGSTVWKKNAERFVFVRGPVFANLVLADEINRTSPRTLSCLLEAMEERVVTIEGRTAPLPEPFLVLATRNPVEFHGTFPIPEAALDRFLVRVELQYPGAEQEQALYLGRDAAGLLEDTEPVLTLDQLRTVMATVDTVTVSPPVAAYAYAVVDASRRSEEVTLGASPRAALAWLRAGKARALLHGRDHVLPDDLRAMAVPVLAHRVFLSGGGRAHDTVARLVGETPVAL